MLFQVLMKYPTILCLYFILSYLLLIVNIFLVNCNKKIEFRFGTPLFNLFFEGAFHMKNYEKHK